MPAPLGQEPDNGPPIHKQVEELIRKAYTDRMAPIGITFSTDGYRLAQSQTVPGMQVWGGAHHAAETYLGLPFTVDNATWAKTVVLVLVPGASAEAKAFRDRNRTKAKTAGEYVAAVRARADRLDQRPTLEVLAEGLTRHQLCDVISHWCVANSTDPMVPGLRRVLGQYGSFE